jgi:hypothetical protein
LASSELNNGGTPYSVRERNVFKLLPKDGKRISTEQLAKKYYKRNHGSQMHANANIIGIMRSLIRKIEVNKAPVRIMKSARAGPYPVEFWLEKR